MLNKHDKITTTKKTMYYFLPLEKIQYNCIHGPSCPVTLSKVYSVHGKFCPRFILALCPESELKLG